MANISLEGSIRTCKVDTAWADKLWSDRFMNPNNMMCPAWNGVDTAGRPVCGDSYWTKRAGCNSALDRVAVENDLRPQYMEYITLDASGIRGGQQCPQGKLSKEDVNCHQRGMTNLHLQTGQFGYQTGFSQNIAPNCLSCNTTPATQNTWGGSTAVENYINYKNNLKQQNLMGRLTL